MGRRRECVIATLQQKHTHTHAHVAQRTDEQQHTSRGLLSKQHARVALALVSPVATKRNGNTTNFCRSSAECANTTRNHEKCIHRSYHTSHEQTKEEDCSTPLGCTALRCVRAGGHRRRRRDAEKRLGDANNTRRLPSPSALSLSLSWKVTLESLKSQHEELLAKVTSIFNICPFFVIC